MSTVPKAGDPPPADNSHEKLVSDPWSGNYGRPTAGGAATGNNQGAGPGVTPGLPAMPAGPFGAAAPVSTANTQVGPQMGHGATIVVPSSGDRPSGGSGAGPGTVGPSENQGGAGPGGMPKP